ncbi:MAG: hypothetical protein QM764_19365 [Chitinophagaceae bacterium]
MRRNFTSDQILTDQLFLNDTDAFEEIYHRHWYALYSYSFSKLKSHQDAKTIVSNVFVALWNERNTLPINFSLSAYLYSQVRNEVVKSVNNKMNNEAEEDFVEEQILPGFATQELVKARKPVTVKDVYLKPGRVRLAEVEIAPKESLLSKYYPKGGFRTIKHTLQTMLNF